MLFEGKVASGGKHPVVLGNGVRLVQAAMRHRDRLTEIQASAEVSRWWGEPDLAASWPRDDPEEPDTVRLVVVLDPPRAAVADEDVVGLIQYAEMDVPEYRHAGVDIFLDAGIHGRGVGRESVRALAEFLFAERGHHRLVIDPAADNAAAIACYSAVGFRVVGVMRQYERNPDGKGWHDGLLMDLLRDDLLTKHSRERPGS